MKLLPSQLLSKNSAAEIAVFKLLRDVELGQGSVAIHSLNLPRHEYKRWAEADFVIISPLGILLLEIKGGRVACKDGLWEFTNRFNETNRRSESPATQAKTAFFALRDNYLNARFRTDIRGIPMGWGVIFTDIKRPVSRNASALPDQPDELTAYRDDITSAKKLAGFLRSALSYWADRTKRDGQLPVQTVREIATYLRPSFEQVPPLANRLEEFGENLAALTEEQYDRLDDIQENARILIRGGAGTGKTFLAMAAARYEAAEGRDVLFVTRSEHLIAELQYSDPPAKLTLIDYSHLGAKREQRGRPWDTLIIDEAQDLCQQDALFLLDRSVLHGLENGRWRWFGDPNRQVSENFPIDESVLEYYLELATKFRLRQNVRNAPKIVEAIVRYVGADAGSPSKLGQGSDVSICAAPKSGAISTSVSIVRGWVSGEDAARRAEVALLVPCRSMVEPALTGLNAAGIRAERLMARAGRGTRDAVVVSTIEEFKGLERPLVCVSGLTSDDKLSLIQAAVYQSFSRANHTLALVCTDEEVSKLAHLAIDLTTKVQT